MKDALISIGKLAEATGLTVERLRIWELRYGKPASQRLPSGHRRYAPEEVLRLVLVKKAIEEGQRPSKVVGLSSEELRALLSADGSAWEPETWVSAARRMDDVGLQRAFQKSWAELGTLRFLSERVEPFLSALGAAWAAGSVSVAEEHFGSEKLSDFLASLWRRLNESNSGPMAILTSLPGDTHALGLQMAATVAAMAGTRVLYLGPSTPLSDISLSIKRTDAKALLIGVSAWLEGQDAGAQLDALKKELPAKTLTVLGGSGAPKGKQGWVSFSDLNSFYAWCRELQSSQADESKA